MGEYPDQPFWARPDLPVLAQQSPAKRNAMEHYGTYRVTIIGACVLRSSLITVLRCPLGTRGLHRKQNVPEG